MGSIPVHLPPVMGWVTSRLIRHGGDTHLATHFTRSDERPCICRGRWALAGLRAADPAAAMDQLFVVQLP